jgi:predicted phosphoribosyltransferase
MGAIASGGVLVLNEDVLVAARVTRSELAAATRREQAELARRERAYRGALDPIEFAGRTVLAVDDGLATGATMMAAVAALRRRDAKAVVVAAPVAARKTFAELAGRADAIECALTPEPFIAVGVWYRAFRATTDAEVRALLEDAARRT